MSYDSWLESPYQQRTSSPCGSRTVCVELPVPTSNPAEWCPMDYFKCTVHFYDGDAEDYGECNDVSIKLPESQLQALGEWFREECA